LGEYTGTNLYVIFGSTALTTDYRSWTEEETIDTVDKTAGADTVKTYLTTTKDGTASIDVLDSTGGTAMWAAVAVGTEGTLEWAPEGTATTKPRHYVNAIVTSRSKPVAYADVVTFTVNFQFSGAVTDTVYSA